MKHQDKQRKSPKVTAIKFNGKNKGGFKNKHPHPQFRLCNHPNKKPRLHILFVTSDQSEQSAAQKILSKEKHYLYFVNDIVSLIQLLHQRKRFDVVIVSEKFTKIGFAFFPLYFKLGLSKRLPKFIQLGSEDMMSGYAANLHLPIDETQLDKVLWA